MQAQPAVQWSSVRFDAGDAVQPMTCNVQSLGCFPVGAEGCAQSLRQAHDALDAVEQRLGRPFAR